MHAFMRVHNLTYTRSKTPTLTPKHIHTYRIKKICSQLHTQKDLTVTVLERVFTVYSITYDYCLECSASIGLIFSVTEEVFSFFFFSPSHLHAAATKSI